MRSQNQTTTGDIPVCESKHNRGPRAAQLVSILCSMLLTGGSVSAQDSGSKQSVGSRIGDRFDRWTQPYKWVEVSPVNLGNSSRLDALVRAGKLYLSLQDCIALAIENNLDIEIQRYAPRISETDLLRAQAGAAIRGGNNTLSSATSTNNQGILSGATTQVSTGAGGVSTNLDPAITGALQWGHQTTPLTSIFTTGNNSLVSTRQIGNLGITQGFLTGTSVSMGFNNTFLNQNSGRNDFNPSTNSYLGLTLNQHLLQGFGRAVNDRNIRIAKNNVQISDLVFRQQVIATVATIIGQYWDLVSFNEDVKVKRQALQLSQKLYEDNKKQVEIGTLAPIEIIRAEAEVATRQQDLTISETNVLQQETILKNALSRTGTSSPALSDAHIVPTDVIRMPNVEAIEPIQDLMGRALEGRPELSQSKVNIENAKIGLKGTRNTMLPTLDAFVDLRNNALAGQVNSLPVPPVQGAPLGTISLVRNPNAVDKYFLGGYGTVLGQIFGRNFPDYSVGLSLNIPLRNRSAQADMMRDQLNLRQAELRLQAQANQIRVEVQNALIALQQARARYSTASKNRTLQEQTLDAEQKKYALGASTIFFVIQYQRDLATAQAAEVSALSAYARARVDLDRATGGILPTYGIQIEEAVKGQVSRPASQLPPDSK